MALISNMTGTWSEPVALGSAEIWQVRQGVVYFSTASAPGDDDGIMLTEGQAVELEAGLTVRFRHGGSPNSVLSRETV